MDAGAAGQRSGLTPEGATKTTASRKKGGCVPPVTRFWTRTQVGRVTAVTISMTVVTDEGMALVDQIRQKKRPAPSPE